MSREYKSLSWSVVLNDQLILSLNPLKSIEGSIPSGSTNEQQIIPVFLGWSHAAQ